MFNKLYFPFNLGSGNRGCEAILRGTLKMLQEDVREVFVLDKNNDEKELDIFLGLGEYCAITTTDRTREANKYELTLRKWGKKIGFGKGWFEYYPYKRFLSSTDKESLVMFTGGDLYCYEKMALKLAEVNKRLKKRAIKTVLWGCSVDKSALANDKVRNSLRKYDFIVCRESITFNTLKEVGVEKVMLCPDPAFVLDPEPTELPAFFENKDIIGINVSNFVHGNVGFDTIFGKNLLKLIEYLIQNTNFNIVLIPHVFWDKHDDRIICNAIYEKFKESGRVFPFNTEKMNYCQIRHAISKCRFFIGARTHSMISAYSTCVPALALGYSVKSVGIARDIGLPEQLVVNYNDVKRDDELVRAVEYLLQNEETIRVLLKEVMPDYCKNAYKARDVLENIM